MKLVQVRGILTRQLSKAAKSVICYEIDMQLEEYLINLSNELSNVEVVFSDFLDADLAKRLVIISTNIYTLLVMFHIILQHLFL